MLQFFGIPALPTITLHFHKGKYWKSRYFWRLESISSIQWMDTLPLWCKKKRSGTCSKCFKGCWLLLLKTRLGNGQQPLFGVGFSPLPKKNTFRKKPVWRESGGQIVNCECPQFVTFHHTSWLMTGSSQWLHYSPYIHNWVVYLFYSTNNQGFGRCSFWSFPIFESHHAFPVSFVLRRYASSAVDWACRVGLKEKTSEISQILVDHGLQLLC